MDAATPMAPLFHALDGVDMLFCQVKTLAITGVWSLCVPVCNADTQRYSVATATT